MAEIKEAFGGLSTDWKEGIDWASVRQWRLRRAPGKPCSGTGLGALLLMYDEKHAIRFLDLHAGVEPAEARPALCGAVRGQGADRLRAGRHGIHLKTHNPWIPPENIRHSCTWIKSSHRPASRSQVTKFVTALVNDLENTGVWTSRWA